MTTDMGPSCQRCGERGTLIDSSSTGLPTCADCFHVQGQAVPLPGTAPARPRVQLDVPAEEYHRRELGVVTSTALSQLARSPAHYRAWVDGHDKETPAKKFRRAAHVAILEPDVFARDWVIPPEFKGKGSKAAKAEWMAAHEGKHLLAADAHTTVERMRQSLMRHPAARELLEAPGHPEATVRWTDPETGLTCKARADIWLPGRCAIVDLKTAAPGPKGFAKAVGNYGYHRQHAHYLAGFESECVDAFYFVAVEKEPPYAVAVWRLDAEAAERGRELRRAGMDVMTRCQEADAWPAYGEGLGC